MTTNQNNKKKNTAARKLIPAIGMLTVSAMMLSSSTYAWFTMSREVEVKNIQMVATVPEDIQISLGRIYKNDTAEADTDADASLAMSSGYLHGGDNGGATTPALTGDKAAVDWSNTADISAYYQLGRLIPASSTDGADIFFTPDADGVGKTVKTDAKYYKANVAATGGAGAAESTVGSGTGNLNATLHAKTLANATTAWNPTKSTAWNVTGDDGYYVDIPVWLRTSSSSGAQISVQAFVVPQNAAATTEKLYKAVRVAVLPPATQETGGGTVTATDLLPVADGWDTSTNAVSTTPYAGNSVLTWYNRNSDDKVAVASLSGTNAVYDEASVYTAGTAFVTLTAGSGSTYGAPSKMIIRVWLEGEDTDCWNETAGQDWSINLKFNNNSTNTASSSSVTGHSTP